jgi:hypothetical protein
MNRVELIVHSSILLIALGLAYGAWKAEEPEERRAFAIFETGKQGVSEITWEDKKTATTIAVSDDGTSWITHGRRKPLPPEKKEKMPDGAPSSSASPDAGTTDGDAGHSGGEPASAPQSMPADTPESSAPRFGELKSRSFPGNEAAKQLIKSLAPVRALRQFDDLDAETLEAMGMSEPDGRLHIKTPTGKSVVFEVGATAYGTRNTYVRVEGSPTVYLLGDDIVSTIRAADSRLMERRLWTNDTTDILYLDITAKGAGAASSAPTRLDHKSRQSLGGSFWTRSGSEIRSVEIDGFVEKLFDLRAQTYPLPESAPSAANLEPVFTVQITTLNAAPQNVDFARSAGETGKEKWYAKSGLTRDWVTVRPSIAADMADLLPKLVEGVEDPQ